MHPIDVIKTFQDRTPNKYQDSCFEFIVELAKDFKKLADGWQYHSGDNHSKYMKCVDWFYTVLDMNTKIRDSFVTLYVVQKKTPYPGMYEVEMCSCKKENYGYVEVDIDRLKNNLTKFKKMIEIVDAQV